MSLTIFGAFPKDPAGEVSVMIPAFGNIKQKDISRVIKSSPLLVYLHCTILFRKHVRSFCSLWL